MSLDIPSADEVPCSRFHSVHAHCSMLVNVSRKVEVCGSSPLPSCRIDFIGLVRKDASCSCMACFVLSLAQCLTCA